MIYLICWVSVLVFSALGVATKDWRFYFAPIAVSLFAIIWFIVERK